MIVNRELICILLVSALISSVWARTAPGQNDTTIVCSGSAKYKITFFNFLSDTGPFSDVVPKGGLAFSPMTAVTHDPRVSLFTSRDFASKALEMICETGANARMLREARALKDRVTSAESGTGGILGGNSYTVEVNATCENYYLTALSMVAPSPDWIVQINNMPLMEHGKFINSTYGHLLAYDCGTDSGSNFTDPSDLSLDIPTKPADNIVPLFQDETDRFGEHAIGFYLIHRV